MAKEVAQQPAQEKPPTEQAGAKKARDLFKHPSKRMPFSGDPSDPEGKSEEHRKRREKAEKGEY